MATKQSEIQLEKLPPECEYVCRNQPEGMKGGDLHWYYKDGVYYKSDENGIHRKIKGSSLPDPNRLWRKRKKKNIGVSANSLKPQDATFKLWEHWQCRSKV